MKVSVIIPVYNVENYLNHALDSVINQTYKNIEIILIDDGSTDLSGDICDKYADLNSNIRVIHKKNEGLSVARNYGINISEGEFIFFLDPDDYIESYAIEEMINLHIKYDVDIVSTRISRVFNHEEKKNLEPYNVYHVIGNESLKYMYLDKLSTVSACAKLYKKEVFKGIKYPINKIYEDFYIIPYIVNNTKSILFADLYTYNYYKRNNSITNAKYTIKQRDFFIAVDNNYNILKNNKELIKYLEYKIFNGVQNIINMAINSNEKRELDYIKKQLKKYNFFNKEISFKIKFKMLIFMMSTDVYYYMIKLIKGNKCV